MSDDKDLLIAQLRSARRHILGILDGLDEEALLRPVLPSGWSCAGLVSHLAADDERFWFGAVVAGDAEAIGELTDDPVAAWAVPDGMTAAQVLDRYRAEAERSDAIVLARSLDGLPDIAGHLAAHGEKLAGRLLDAHRRVRQASAEVVRGLKVTVEPGADVLGVFVFVPPAGGHQ